MPFYIKNLKTLCNTYKEDADIMELIQDSLISFLDYQNAIYKMEIYTQIYNSQNLETKNYQNMLLEFDKARSLAHNNLISKINILNRLCKESKIAPVYDGIVSENRPYRIKIADAILEFVNTTVKERKK